MTQIANPDRTLLIVEDDDETRRALVARLNGEGYTTLTCAPGDDVTGIALAKAVALTLVGVPLPGRDAFDVARELRLRTSSGVIVLGSSDDEVDITVALEMGADDYMLKPVRPRELCARIRSVLRRTVVTPADGDGARPLPDHFLRRVDDIEICGVKRIVSVAGTPVELTDMEFDVLLALAANTNAVLSRERIIESVRGRDWSVNDRAVDGIISRLRRKLFDDAEAAKRIRTVRGIGYMLLQEG